MNPLHFTPSSSPLAPPNYSERSLPPAYKPGVSVVKKANCNQYDIFRMEPDGPPDRVLAPGTIVSGRAIVHPTMAFHFKSVEVELVMIESTAKPTAYGEARTTRNISLDKYIVPTKCYASDNRFRNGYEYTITFSLKLPEILPVSACSAAVDDHYQLPPSIGGTPERPEIDLETGENFPARITYRVISRIWGEEKTLLSVFENLRVSPLHHQHVDDYQGQTFQTEPGELKQGLIRKSSIGSCKLAVADPPVLHLLSKSTFLFNLVVSYIPPSNEDNGSLRTIQRISYRLQSHTITSEHPVTHIPSINEPGLLTYTQNLTRQKIEGPKLDWHVNDSTSGSLGRANLTTYYSTVQLPLVLPQGNKQFVAEFSTCMITRKYSLHITVHFGASVTTTLTVPVRVVAS